MSLYFGETEITGLHFGDIEITGLYFGDTEIWTAWAEYDGTLPATYTANGSVLADYRIYGADGGVGDRTSELYNKYGTNAANGYIASTYLGSAGQTTATSDTAWSVGEYIPVDSEETYTILTGNTSANLASVVEYDDGKNVVVGTAYARRANFQLTTNAQTKYLRISAYASSWGSHVVKGSTVPETYVPYGYEVDMSVSDGTTSTTTTIYIGDEPLGEDEYVDYQEGKVYRRTENLFNKNGNLSNGLLQSDGSIISSTNVKISEFIAVSEQSYFLSGMNPNSARTYSICFYDSNYAYVRGIAYEGARSLTIIPQTGEEFVRFCILNSALDTAMLIEGSTAPSAYIPYLQPEDPPIPLPQLPTVNGVTITDYAGQSAAVPSRFYAKYKKGGQAS